MKEINDIQILEVNGGAVFLAYFAAAYVGSFAFSAGFAYGAVTAMAE